MKKEKGRLQGKTLLLDWETSLLQSGEAKKKRGRKEGGDAGVIRKETSRERLRGRGSD